MRNLYGNTKPEELSEEEWQTKRDIVIRCSRCQPARIWRERVAPQYEKYVHCNLRECKGVLYVVEDPMEKKKKIVPVQEPTVQPVTEEPVQEQKEEERAPKWIDI